MAFSAPLRPHGVSTEISLNDLAHSKDAAFIYGVLFKYIMVDKQFLPAAKWFIAQEASEQAAYLRAIITQEETASAWAPLLNPANIDTRLSPIPSDALHLAREHRAYHPFNLRLLDYCFVMLANPQFFRDTEGTPAVILAGERGLWSRLRGAHRALTNGEPLEAKRQVGEAVTIRRAQKNDESANALSQLHQNFITKTNSVLQAELDKHIAFSAREDKRLVVCGKASHLAMMNYLLQALSNGLFNRKDADKINAAFLFHEAYAQSLRTLNAIEVKASATTSQSLSRLAEASGTPSTVNEASIHVERSLDTFSK